jgi:hypothetical protein
MIIGKVDMIVRRFGMSKNLCCRDGCANLPQTEPSKKGLASKDNNVNHDGQLESFAPKVRQLKGRRLKICRHLGAWACCFDVKLPQKSAVTSGNGCI